MKLPKAHISINYTVDWNEFLNPLDIEYLERVREDDLKNKLEEWIRDNIWDCIPDNKINIEFD